MIDKNLGRGLLGAVLFFILLPGQAGAWWDKEWKGRKEITLAAPGEIPGSVGDVPVLLRLHEGNFSFGSAGEDGSDLRFVAWDDKTLLKHHVEKWDGLMGEGFVWVRVPGVKPGEPVKFWLYYGNGGGVGRIDDPKGTYDGETVGVYHFGEHGAPAGDASGNNNSSEKAGVAADGSMIGTGLKLEAKGQVVVPASESLKWGAGGGWSWSAWVKPLVLQPNAVIFSRGLGTDKSLVIGMANGAPYVEVKNGGAAKRTAAGAGLEANSWKHLAVTADGGLMTLYVDGKSYQTLEAGLPEVEGPLVLGSPGPEVPGLNGEIDELQISKVARPGGWVQFAALSQGGQGGEKGSQMVQFGEEDVPEEGGALSHALEHVMLFGDIAKNMMFDGWLVVFFCAVMAAVGWTVAIGKFLYLKKIQKGSEEFLRQWKNVAGDLTALDHSNAESVKSLGGAADPRGQRLMHQSPLYHIYHIGSEEIRHRLMNPNGFNGLSARSIQAIKASLHSGLTHEVHKMNGGMIFLTISIAGGPYVGLLGTVMGVMITFAVIAKSGEVDVNNIAPGIASALLATVAGLVVAIPALFIYSFLNSKIKDAISHMQLFIDEFISKMAEFYPTPAERERPWRPELEEEEEALR